MIQHSPGSLAEWGWGAHTSELQIIKPTIAASGEMWISNEQNQEELSQLITISCNLRVPFVSTAISACIF